MLQQMVDYAHAWHKHDIAEMTNEQLARLNYDAMVEIVLASEMPVRDVERIRSFEGDTVSRLAWMAREHCRQCAT